MYLDQTVIILSTYNTNKAILIERCEFKKSSFVGPISLIYNKIL